jgi:sugar O-acyltransferase (sialic acid O-acetyltransferase NeuD family)
MANGFYRNYGKRFFDLAVAIPALIVLSPVLALTALAVRRWLGSPVLFRQERPGFQGRPFFISKFRTMTDERDAAGNLLPDDLRLTRFGKFLRASSLDELPELWNIITGQMSLVGPRPLKMSYLSRYSPEQARRHDVVPGLTGWAQVNGRNSLSWEKRFELDVWYVDHCSLWLDIKTLWLTVAAVFGRKGISAEGHSTMPDFEGSTTSSPEAVRFVKALATTTRPTVVVIGGGGHGKVVVSTLQAAGYEVDAVYDDNPQAWGRRVLGVPVRGPVSELQASCGVSGVIGVGAGAVRERLAQTLPVHWLTVVHPQAMVHPSVKLGPGTVVFAGAVIQPDATVGEHSIVNTMASIDHDGSLGSFTNLGPGSHLSGNVSIGDRCLIGTGSSIIPGISIGDDVTVGAGTVVIRDLPSGCTVVGATPRMIHSRQTDTSELKAA